MARILVIGGSYLQSNFIEDAIEYGHEIIFVDKDPLCYSRKNSKACFYNIDFLDEESLLELCKKKRIEAIISPANEVGNIIASRLCKKLDLSYNSEEVVKYTLDKSLLRKKLINSNISTPNHLDFNGDITEVLEKLQLPLIVKPSNSSGSRGISSIHSKNEFPKALELAKKHLKPSGQILIEELLEGIQFSIETISSNYEHFLVGITLEKVSGPPRFIERSHFMGPTIFEKYYEKLNSFSQDLLKKLGVKVGPCHIEVILQKDEIFLVEIGSRSGGLRDLLLKYCGSSNYSELIIDSYLGKVLEEKKFKKPTINSTVGIIMFPEDLQKYLLAKKDGSLREEFFYGKGPSIEPQNLTDAFGYFYAVNEVNIFQYKLDKLI